MRILAFNYEYPPLGGGGGVVFQQLVEVLAKRHEVTVVTSGYRGLADHEHSGGLEIIRVPVRMRNRISTASMVSMLSYFLGSWRCGRKLASERTFDVINSHFAVPSSPSAHLIARRFSIPHVVSIHGGDLYDPSKRMSPHRIPVLRRVVGNLMRAADRLVAQSTNTASNARTFYGITRPIDIIPLGIVLPELEAATRKQMGIEEDRFVMITIGRLVARKGLEDLLRILAKMNDSRDLLLIVGDGPKRTEWEALAATLGVADRVRFVGRISEADKWRYLCVADLYASTSLHEGFGLVFLEAMHCGLPVATYDYGGQTDFLVDGKTGAMVAVGKSAEFAAALQRLKESPKARRDCAARNKLMVQDYSIDRCAERYEGLFEETIGSSDVLDRAGSQSAV